MSLSSINNSKVLGDKIHGDAKPNSVYLKGRILKLTKVNPKFNPRKPDEPGNRPDIIEQVSMTKEDIKSSEALRLLGTSPISIEIKSGWECEIPTGMKFPKLNKERKLRRVGPVVVTHGELESNKSLDSFFQ